MFFTFFFLFLELMFLCWLLCCLLLVSCLTFYSVPITIISSYLCCHTFLLTWTHLDFLFKMVSCFSTCFICCTFLHYFIFEVYSAMCSYQAYISNLTLSPVHKFKVLSNLESNSFLVILPATLCIAIYLLLYIR